MPRIARGLADGFVYHILNRGNGGQEIFHKAADYQAFIELMVEAKKRYPLEIFGYCLMPNHFHMVVRPIKGQHLSKWMQWLMTSHVRRYHKYYGSSGHIWQGRFKSFIIQQDNHLLTVLRYVEGNPLRAGLVTSVLDWYWSSHREVVGKEPNRLVDVWPIETPEGWRRYVDLPQTATEIECLRRSVNRQGPFGDPEWQVQVSKQLGLESTLRPRGRPPKKVNKD